MTGLLLVTFPAFLLEDDHFVAAYVAKHLRADTDTLHQWTTNFHFARVVKEHDILEFHVLTNLAAETVNIDFLVLFNFKLLTCDIDYGVHSFSFLKI